MKRLMLCMGIALACATAGAANRAPIWSAPAGQTWSAWGGTIGVHCGETFAEAIAKIGRRIRPAIFAAVSTAFVPLPDRTPT